MGEEVERWWRQAKEDLKSAEVNFENNIYYVCAFLCQQSIEKGLKALLLKKTGKIRKIHDLVILAKSAELPVTRLANLKEMSLAYIYVRYPDVKQSIDLRKKAAQFLDTAKETLKWLEENL